MYFFSKQTNDLVVAQKRFNAVVENPIDFRSTVHYNGFDYPKTPVVSNADRQLIQQYQWGLIPVWAKDENIRQYNLNARIETLNDKPSFRDSVNRRCLVLSDGFFEWQWLDSKGKHKQKYEITLPSKELFAFAAIWSEWVNALTGERVRSYSILTTEATGLMREIHNSKKRMAVVLTSENEQDWLNGRPLREFEKSDVELQAVKMDVESRTGLLF